LEKQGYNLSRKGHGNAVIEQLALLCSVQAKGATKKHVMVERKLF